MPMTEFARMRRSDHSMRPPIPAASLAFKSPNACNLCHTNKDASWADRSVREWSKRDYQKPELERASLVAAARRSDWARLPDMLAYLSSPNHDEIFTVSLVRLLATCGADSKWLVLRKLLKDPSPLVRGSVAEALGERLEPPNVEALLSATSDDYRLVRVRAANALGPMPADQAPENQRQQFKAALAELMDSMKSQPDDMASHYNLGNFHMSRAQMQEAATEFETATRLQPEALPPRVNAAMAYNSLGQNEKAETSLRQALELDPTNVVANLNLGMLLGEMGKLPQAAQAFRTAFKADPRSAQAAYNLGVLLAADQPREALSWSRCAAELRPDNPQYGYTYAFYLYQSGNPGEALKAIRKVRDRFPSHQDSRLLEQQLLKESEQKPKSGSDR